MRATDALPAAAVIDYDLDDVWVVSEALWKTLLWPINQYRPKMKGKTNVVFLKLWIRIEEKHQIFNRRLSLLDLFLSKFLKDILRLG